jgi:DNA-directed RNA polymerase
MLTDAVMDTQRDLEDASFLDGAERYRAAQERKAERDGYDRRDDVSKMIRGAIPLVAHGVREWVETAKAAKGRKPVALKPVDLLDADRLAYLGLSHTFRELPDGGNVTHITNTIGRMVQVELEAAAIQEADKAKAKRYRALAEGEANEEVLLKRHESLRDELGIDLGWSCQTQVLVGQAVLGVILVKLPDIFERHTFTENGKVHSIVRLTEEAAAVLARMHEELAWMRPNLQPMLTLPRPWTSLSTGCYHDTRLARTVDLVRTYSGEHKKLLRDAIKDGSMQEVLDAVNAIQETRWAIDSRVLAVIGWAREEGKRPTKSFPAHDDDLPAKPKKMPKAAWEALTPAQRSAMSRKRKAVVDIRRNAGVEAAMFGSDFGMAAFLAEHEFFCLPHSLDFRGRVYAVPHFNHQRSDHMKALFRFADGVPMGPDGGRWLMIHLANCGDFGKISKKPFDARLSWVRENEADILMCARYPEDAYDYWSQADSPFCFLQACFEYDAWMRSGFSEDFESTIAVAMDGSCSGLQHYAALTRSSQEAHHVNLVPRDTVGDIYQIVADAALPTLEAQAAREDDELAKIVLANGFGRSEVKRNVMTYFYGSGKFGMRDQHMEDKMRPLADKVAMGEIEAHPYAVVNPKTGNLDGGYSCAQVMALHTYQAVVTVAPKADEAASWIQQVAAVLAHESLSMVWRTPTGMPVVQRYSEYTSKRINLWLYDRQVLVPEGNDRIDAEGNILSRVQLLIREAPTKRVEKKRMRSASSPNVIHSMDGAHLQRSVVMGKAAGIEHFAMIHDSFGTHAGNSALFANIIREAFVSIYQDYCPLAELDRYARSVLSDQGIEKLPPIPAKGDLDLTAILKSLYAFA